jgi:predicted nucleotidyltransferase
LGPAGIACRSSTTRPRKWAARSGKLEPDGEGESHRGLQSSRCPQSCRWSPLQRGKATAPAFRRSRGHRGVRPATVGRAGYRGNRERLFGSKATGQDACGSDIEILVIVCVARLETEDRVLAIAFDINLVHEVYISPRVVSQATLRPPRLGNHAFPAGGARGDSSVRTSSRGGHGAGPKSRQSGTAHTPGASASTSRPRVTISPSRHASRRTPRGARLATASARGRASVR